MHFISIIHCQDTDLHLLIICQNQIAGQGFCLAVEDGVVLAWHLRAQGLSPKALRRSVSTVMTVRSSVLAGALFTLEQCLAVTAFAALFSLDNCLAVTAFAALFGLDECLAVAAFALWDWPDQVFG